MDVLEYQHAIARLAIDRRIFEEFKSDPAGVANVLAKDPAVRIKLQSLDVNGLQDFVDVIAGSRATTFSIVLPELYDECGDEDWAKWMDAFHRETVITNSSNWQDLKLFCEWLDGRYPSTRAQALAEYGYALQRVASASRVALRPNQYLRHPKVQYFSLHVSPEDIFDPAIPLTDRNSDDGGHWLGLIGSFDSDDVDVTVLDAGTVQLLDRLATPHTPADLARGLGEVEPVVQSLLMELEAEGLLVTSSENLES